jgi:hypothetical protein
MKPGLIFLVVLLISCSLNKNTEFPNNLCPDLTWLNKRKTPYSEIYINKYKGEWVFEINSCPDCADAMVSVYNCEGKRLCDFGGIGGLNTCPDYEQNSIGSLLYWKNGGLVQPWSFPRN